MVPDKFNMVDMGGIDLIMMQGEAVPGLYDKLMAAISNCRYQCLYNWLFDGILIPPTYVQIEVDDDEVYLNEGVSVTSDNVIHIYSVEPGPVDPEIIPLLAEENGTYTVPAGKDGFNPVTVDVPSYTPVIGPITITENGTYNAPASVDGYSPVIVSVPSQQSQYDPLFPAVDSGLQLGIYSDITSPSRGGVAPSGTIQVISSTEPIDVTNLSTIIFEIGYRNAESNTNGPIRFGVAQSVPTTWEEVLASLNVTVGSGNNRYSIDVSALSGDYYLFYAASLTFGSYGWVRCSFRFPVI